MGIQKHLNVCVVNPNYYRSSGVTVAIKRIYEGSKDLSINWFFVDCKYGSEVEIAKPQWIPSNRLSFFNLMSNSPFKLVLSIFSFYQYLNRNNINVIHCHHRRIAVLAGWVARFVNIPIVYTGQLPYKKNRFFYLAPELKPIAISESVKENILQTSRFKNISLISNPAKFEEFIPEIKEKHYKTIACIARFDDVKNHETLLKAWSLIQASKYGYELLLVGEGPLKPKLITLTESLNITETVNFIGYTPNVNEIINQCLFLVLPSWLEGHPVVVIEGAGQGRATLVTNVCGSKDCIPPNSLLVNKIDPRSPESLADALKEWFQNPIKVIEEGKNFYEFWHANASSFIVAKKYYQVYLSTSNVGKPILAD